MSNWYEKFIESARKTYCSLQRSGCIDGYTIMGDNDEKMCEICRSQQGYHRRFDGDSLLPPFHPNCRCELQINWKMSASQGVDIAAYYDFNDSGKIKLGATKEIILRGINYNLKMIGLKQDLTWEQVAEIGFYDWGNEVEYHDANLSIDEMNGWTTLLDANSVINVDAGGKKSDENTLDYWLEEAKKIGTKIKHQEFYTNIGIVAEMFGYTCTHARFDLKNNTYDPTGPISEENNIFGNGRNNTRNYWAYIYNGELIKYDHIGNILIGYMGHYAGIDLESLLYWVDKATLVTDFKFDDPADQEAIRKGYEMAN